MLKNDNVVCLISLSCFKGMKNMHIKYTAFCFCHTWLKIDTFFLILQTVVPSDYNCILLYVRKVSIDTNKIFHLLLWFFFCLHFPQGIHMLFCCHFVKPSNGSTLCQISQFEGMCILRPSPSRYILQRRYYAPLHFLSCSGSK